MKKILFLLLLTVASYGQVSTGQETEFDYGIKNNSTQTVTTPTYLTTTGTDGTQGKIPSAYIAKTAAVQDSLNKKINLPTGFLLGLQLSINADQTKFDIAPGYYVVTDFTNLANPVVKIITYPGATGLTPAYLATANSTYVALDINGNVVSSASPFTNADRRTLAIIGNVVHSNNTTINVTNEIKAPIVASTNQVHDFMRAIGFLNEEGNIYSPNGANLQINKSAGKIFGMGINSADYLNPHQLTIPSQTALTFAYRFQGGTQLADTQNINPNIYDVGGVSTPVPVGNRWTIQRINLFQSGLARIQPGQTVYNSFNEAVTALPTQSFVTEQNIADNAVFRCYLIVQQGTTNLASAVAAGTALFVPVDKFGNVIGNGSVALTYANIVAALGYTPANEVDVVKLTGDQTINGSKTFSKSLKMSSVTLPTAPLAVIDGAGVLTGEFIWGISYYTADGKETGIGVKSATLSLSSNKVLLTIPVSADASIIGRKIYRTNSTLGADIVMQLVATIADNTTTSFSDNVANGSLGENAKWFNSTGGEILLNGNKILSVDGQSFSIGLGSSQNRTGYANQTIGNYSGYSMTTGFRNTFTGFYTGYSMTTGFENTATGVHSINYNTTGRSNSAYGYASLFKNETGSDNTVIGYSSFGENLVGDRNIGLGLAAGNHETGSDTFYVGNYRFSNNADERAKSLFFGNLNTEPTLQKLRINAKIGIGVAADSYFDLTVGGNTGQAVATKWVCQGGSSFTHEEFLFPFGGLFKTNAGVSFSNNAAGNVRFEKSISMYDVPNSSGSFDFMVRNTSTEVVEKVSSESIATKALTVRKISTNTTLSDSDNGTIILLTASCTVTLPNGLMNGFNCSFSTQTGVTMTYALGGSVTLINNTGTTMAQNLSHTIVNTGTSNEYLTAGSL